MTKLSPKRYFPMPGYHEKNVDTWGVHTDEHIYFSSVDLDLIFTWLPDTILEPTRTEIEDTTLAEHPALHFITNRTLLFEINDLEALEQILDNIEIT